MRLILTIALLAFCVQANAAQLLKQSTAATVKMGPFVDSTDGVTAETALTISQADVRLSKNGGDYAQKTDATAATHDEIGEYNVPLDATDTGTLGRLRVMVQESGALPVWAEFMVVPANVYDSLVLGTDTLQADTVQWLGTAAATPTTAGVPEVDVVLVDGAATSTSLASAADIVNEWETQSQADPTGFHVNVLEVGGTAQTANDNGADINAILVDTATLPTATPGAAGGLFIAGTNAATTITSSSGSALTLSSTGANGHGLVATGNGSGEGITATGGATGHGFALSGGSTSGDGFNITAQSGNGITLGGGTNGKGAEIYGAGVGAGLDISGDTGITVVGSGADGISLSGTSNDLELANDTAASVLALLGLASGNLDTQLAALPTAAENADAVWDEDIVAAHNTEDSAADVLKDADTAVNVASIGNDVITAASIATDAIGAAEAGFLLDSTGFNGADVGTGSGGGGGAIDMQSTTIATLASQTSFTLTAGSADDDAYPAGSLVFVTDQSTSTQKCVGLLRSYTGATKTVTLAEDPGIFTMATGDTVDIVYLGPPKVRGN